MLTPEQKAELRGHLTVIRGNAELLASDPILPPRVRAKARSIDAAVEEIRTMFGFQGDDAAVSQAILEARSDTEKHNCHLGATADEYPR